jgi:alpha-L-rhamnosidase
MRVFFKWSLFSLISLIPLTKGYAQLTVKNSSPKRVLESTVRERLNPVKILWQTPDAEISNSGKLLKPGIGQASLYAPDLCILKSTKDIKPGILFDFGKELQGGVQIITDRWKSGQPVTVRIRFGESASEAMSDVDTIRGATNDHAMRDFVIKVPWLGKLEVGNTGFRFVRIDLIDENARLALKEVNAIAVYRDIPYLGSFNCSDTLLNKIWKTGAYTVQLNMQDYLLDGIKRDRLVWVGDMHPEVSTINAVFGSNEVVPKSLDRSRDDTPLPDWMNGISAYSMWWILIQRDLYMHNGNLTYLKEQKQYLVKLLGQLISKIGADNSEQLDGNRFLDWPSSTNPKAVHAGLQAMMVMSLKAGAQLCTDLNDAATAKECMDAINRLKLNVPDANGSKQAAALLSLSGLMPVLDANKIISTDGAKRFSTFYGYYMLQAQAKAGDYEGAINNIRTYWGAMLGLGATTFWEILTSNGCLMPRVLMSWCLPVKKTFMEITALIAIRVFAIACAMAGHLAQHPGFPNMY